MKTILSIFVLAGCLLVCSLCTPLTNLVTNLASTSVSESQEIQAENTRVFQAVTATTIPLEPPPHENAAPELMIQNPKTYHIRQTIEAINVGPTTLSQFNLTVALIQDVVPYQEVNAFTITPNHFTQSTDSYGNSYAEFTSTDVSAGTVITYTLDYEVTINEIKTILGNCEGSLIQDEINPETYIESDSSLVTDLSIELSAGKSTSCEQARAFYDYLLEEFTLSEYHPDDLGALYALNNQSGDCTEYTDAFIALNRAAEIPARFQEGLLCCTHGTAIENDLKHDWAEVFLPKVGWVPVDALIGQTSGNPDAYFAQSSNSRVIITRGRTLDKLNDYHYYAYTYSWNGDAPTIDVNETWIFEPK